MKKKVDLTTVEAIRKVRGTWGGVKPVTRIEPNRKHQIPRKNKHKKKEMNT